MKTYALYSYFTFGFLYGYSVGSLSGRPADFSSVAPFLGAWLLFSLVFWIESWNHKRHLVQWQTIKAKGRRHFVLTRYFLLRGTIVTIGLVLYLFLVNLIQHSVTLLILVPLLLWVVYAGYHEWSRCEQESIGLSVESSNE